MAFYFGTLPARSRLSEAYIKSGDLLLAKKKYISADLEYQKAELLYDKNPGIPSKRELAQKAATNVFELKAFYKDRDEINMLDLMERVAKVPRNETEAVRLARELIEKGEFQLAITPAQTATLMDKSYRDAWLYLGIANLETAKNLEINQNVREQYLAKSKEALTIAKNLDPAYQATADLLAEIETQKNKS